MASRGVKALLGAACLLVGCQSHDIGSDCPQMEIPFDGGATYEGDVMRAQGPEVVEYNVLFPCDDPVCVITLGHEPYCSRECRDDAGCPSGFECRPVMDLGPFEGVDFCVWKACREASDCGDPWVLGCEEVAELSLEQSTKVCRYHD